MDIDLNDEQDMLRRSAREFAKRYITKEFVKEMQEDPTGFTDDIWKQMAQLGWMGWVVPTEYGGIGGSFLDLTVLLQEMGRAVFPGPFFSTVVLGGLPILYFGNAEQKKEFLPKICQGELIATMALYEEDIRYDTAGVTLKAIPDEEGYKLSGTKMFVPDAHVADLIICVARTSQAEDGITLFLVDGKRSGIECTVLKPMDGSKQCKLAFDGVKVPRSAVLGTIDKGWEALEKLLELAAVAKCADMLGSAEAVVTMTAQHAKDRVQFGHPIGSYQAVQHHCANMKIDVEAMNLITYQVAWMLSENIPCTKEVAMGKAWSSDALRRIVHTGLRVNGGGAVILEHDLSLHYRKALASEFYFGDARHHRKVVLQQLGV